MRTHEAGPDRAAYIDRAGVVKIRGIDYGLMFSEGLAAAKPAGNPRFGYVDVDGAFRIEGRYHEAATFRDGMAVVSDGKLQGFVSANGDVIEPQFQQAGDFGHGLAPVRAKRGFGFIDKTGKTAIKPTWAWADPFYDDLAAVNVGGKVKKGGYQPSGGRWGAITIAGEIAVEPAFKNRLEFREGLSPASIDGKLFGYIDRQSKWVIEPRFDAAGRMINGYASVSVGGKFGLIDPSGQECIPLEYSWVGCHCDGRVNVYVDTPEGTKQGFADLRGQLVIEPRYSHVWPFSEGLAAVEVEV
jgi:hypothetical protein